MVFIDLKEAFDTVDHDILAKKALPLWSSKFGVEMVQIILIKHIHIDLCITCRGDF